MGLIEAACFHPSKEGFKGFPTEKKRENAGSFHPSKEGFKVCGDSFEWAKLSLVSIPLRKVSRFVWIKYWYCCV